MAQLQKFLARFNPHEKSWYHAAAAENRNHVTDVGGRRRPLDIAALAPRMVTQTFTGTVENGTDNHRNGYNS
jgi:hypothetical protein